MRTAVVVRDLGIQPYAVVWQQLKDFTNQRTADTVDELWCLQHDPVYTLGQAGKPEHILNQAGIPLIRSDRGGQVTYHAPGQLIVYVLVDLVRKKIGVRDLVALLEHSVITLLRNYGIDASTRVGAPGVYVGDSKIAALGLRVRHGRTYHGLSLNIDLDLGPFDNINPCGYAGLTVTKLSDLAPNLRDRFEVVQREYIEILTHALGYEEIRI